MNKFKNLLIGFCLAVSGNFSHISVVSLVGVTTVLVPSVSVAKCRFCLCLNCTGGINPCSTASQNSSHIARAQRAMEEDIADYEETMTEWHSRILNTTENFFNANISAWGMYSDIINEYEQVIHTQDAEWMGSSMTAVTHCDSSAVSFAKNKAERQSFANAKAASKEMMKNSGDIISSSGHPQKDIVEQLKNTKEHFESYCNELDNELGKCTMPSNEKTKEQFADLDVKTSNILTPGTVDNDLIYVYDEDTKVNGKSALDAAYDYVENMTPKRYRSAFEAGNVSANLEYDNLRRGYNLNKNAYERILNEYIGQRIHSDEILGDFTATDIGSKYTGDKMSPRQLMKTRVDMRVLPEYQWATEIRANKRDGLDREMLNLHAEELEVYEKLYSEYEKTDLLSAHILALLNNTLVLDKLEAARSKTSSTGR